MLLMLRLLNEVHCKTATSYTVQLVLAVLPTSKDAVTSGKG